MPIVYYIRCNETSDIYIGSTINSLSRRLWQHRADSRCESRRIINRDNYETGILQNFPDTITKEELLTREGEWIRMFSNSINKIRFPFRVKEWGREWDKQRNKWWRSFGSHRSSPINHNNMLYITPNLLN